MNKPAPLSGFRPVAGGMATDIGWSQDRLEKLWALQRLARKAGNRVVMRELMVCVTRGNETRSFITVEEAADWHGGAP